MLVQIIDFVNWVRRRNPNARTWRDYRSDLHQFVAIVGDQPPETVTVRDVDCFITAQAARGYKPTTADIQCQTRRGEIMEPDLLLLEEEEAVLSWRNVVIAHQPASRLD